MIPHDELNLKFSVKGCQLYVFSLGNIFAKKLRDVWRPCFKKFI